MPRNISFTSPDSNPLVTTACVSLYSKLSASVLIFGLFCDTYSPQQGPKELHDTGASQLPTPQRFATLAFVESCIRINLSAGYFVVNFDLAI
jgi:hypothetical protein